MSEVGLSSPWVIFAKEIEIMFCKDSNIRCVFDENIPEFKIYVDDQIKAEAISYLLPIEKTFGNVTLKISVLPSNRDKAEIDIIEEAFRGNPIVSHITKGQGMMRDGINFVSFKNTVVQYFNDNMCDENGVCSTLYQDIAKEIFGEIDGVYYCTALPEKK